MTKVFLCIILLFFFSSQLKSIDLSSSVNESLLTHLHSQTLFLSCQYLSFMHCEKSITTVILIYQRSYLCYTFLSSEPFFYDTHSSPHRFQPQVNTPHLHSRCGRRSSGLSVGPILIISISHTLSSAAPPPPVSSLFWSRRSSGGLSEFDSLHKQWVWLLSTTGKDSTIDKGLKHIQACWADSGLVQKL